MPEIKFAGVPDQKAFKPAPSGDYILELVDAEDGTVQSGENKGANKTTLQWEIVDAAGELEEFNGRRIYDNVSYSEKALPRLKTMLKAFGADVPDDDSAEPLKWEWDDLIGKKVMAKIRSVPKSRDKNDKSKEYPPKNSIVRFLVPGVEDDDE
jgi:hypothetical protein